MQVINDRIYDPTIHHAEAHAEGAQVKLEVCLPIGAAVRRCVDVDAAGVLVGATREHAIVETDSRIEAWPWLEVRLPSLDGETWDWSARKPFGLQTDAESLSPLVELLAAAQHADGLPVDDVPDNPNLPGVCSAVERQVRTLISRLWPEAENCIAE